MSALVAVLADSWGWHHGDVGIGWWIVMMLGMVVFWGAVVALVVWLLRGGLGVRGDAEAQKEEPLELLRRRLADGSVSVEEFEQRRALLEDADRPAGAAGGAGG
jgi:putative membrane protein